MARFRFSIKALMIIVAIIATEAASLIAFDQRLSRIGPPGVSLCLSLAVTLGLNLEIYAIYFGVRQVREQTGFERFAWVMAIVFLSLLVLASFSLVILATPQTL